MPLVYVAAGPHEIGLWDVEQGKCHQVPAPILQILMAVPLLFSWKQQGRRQCRTYVGRHAAGLPPAHFVHVILCSAPSMKYLTFVG